MKPKSEIKQDLRQFTGTESWHRHLPGVLLTDGAKRSIPFEISTNSYQN